MKKFLILMVLAVAAGWALAHCAKDLAQDVAKASETHLTENH